MKKSCFLVALLLSFFASASMAATQSFWATSTQSDSAMDPTFLTEGKSKSFTINYTLGSNWIINSAKLWLRAVDDYQGNHCSAPNQNSTNCNDDNKPWTPQDPSEQARIAVIEGIVGSYGTPVEINNFKWYDLNINVASYLSNADKKFSATIKAVCGDFWYKNAKIVIDYDLKPVPVPAAIWLFGSALLGLTGMRRKSVINA
jgi:hypothetical protein